MKQQARIGLKLLASLMLALVLVACGGASPAPPSAPTEVADAPTEVPTEVPTDAPAAAAPVTEPIGEPVAGVTAAPTAVPVEPTAVPVEPTAVPVEPIAVPVEPTAVPVEPTAVPVEPTDPVLLKSGFFGTGVMGYSAVGSASLVQQPDGSVAIQLSGFQTQWGPDLFVYLSGSGYPLSGAEMEAGGAIEVARLSSHSNPEQTYFLAPGDYSGFNSVVIWCRAFDHVFSAATLQ